MGLDRLDDAELVARCRRDRDAVHGSFRALYERHAPGLYRYLRSLVGDDAAAADCLQETFLQVFRNLDRYDARRPFRPWLFGVARRVGLEDRRRGARHPAAPLVEEEVRGPASAPVAEAERREERRLLDDAVGSLPAPEREVFLLRQGEGLTYAAVADAVGCSVRTAKNRMRAALSLLSVALRQRGLVDEGGAL